MCLRSPHQPSPATLVVALGLALAVVACSGKPADAPAPQPAPAAQATPPLAARSSQPASPAVAASRPAAAPPTTAPAAAAPPPPASVPAAARAGHEAADRAGLKRLRVEVNGPLETGVVKEVGEALGPRLAQVIVRPLVWWLAVPADLVRGDRLEVLYEEPAGEHPIVHAVRYQSQRRGRTYRAYRFKPAGAQWPRLYSADGAEVEQRFVHPPLADYEQVTSLVNDGRRHKGVDFKAPIGTPVRSPFAARVTRKNWHFKGNGNSLELREVGGRGLTALFLHLAEPPALAVGAHVSPGQVVGKCGNTGRSFAPHLHYQLMQGPKVLDPFTTLPTQRVKLAAQDRAAFATEVARLDRLLERPQP